MRQYATTSSARSSRGNEPGWLGRDNPLVPAAALWPTHKGPRRQSLEQRNAIELCINRINEWRGTATHYVRTATIYLAGLHITGIFLWSAR